MKFDIQFVDVDNVTEVDHYWNRHTVLDELEIRSLDESIRRFEDRNGQYPLLREKMGNYHGHDGETYLDYGCGPGDDFIGFLSNNRLKKAIGIDVSLKALEQLRYRLVLHTPLIENSPISLVKISNATKRIPLEDESVDFINCSGVLQHTNEPETILREFRRVLKPGGSATIMVYNYDSLWLHLFTAYVLLIRNKGQFRNQILERTNDIRTIFSRTCDGLECPIARIWKPQEFTKMSEDAGLKAKFYGGFFAPKELNTWIGRRDDVYDWRKLVPQAVTDPNLPREHKEFLESLTEDSEGFPIYNGHHAGICGVYKLFIA